MKGIYSKYIIGKADGSRVDPDADYFVLRIDKDKHARKALKAYADSIKEENPRLSEDIYLKLCEYGFDKRQIKLEEVDFSVRTYNCLKRAGINTLGELVQKTEQEIKSISNLSKKGFGEIERQLCEYEFELQKEGQ